MATNDFQPVYGMTDIGPPEVYTWQQVEEQARKVLNKYGFDEVRTPIVERNEVFVRSLGDTTDIVQKEMFTFVDRGDRQLTLRPEGTAGVIRYVASCGQDALNGRFYYVGPMFRAERPQAGRRRQFHQFGVEMIGAALPALDAECIALQAHLLSEWGLSKFTVNINTRGLPEDIAKVGEGLRKMLSPHRGQLCADCQRRFEQNILRVLDCKEAGCQEMIKDLPPMTDFMADDSKRYFAEVLRFLELLKVDVKLNPRLVRGLDYYVHTVFEITHGGLGSQDALSGGGRYQISFGDRTIPGVGFAIGLERVIVALQSEQTQKWEQSHGVPLWFISLGTKAFEENLKLAMIWRRKGLPCALDMEGRSLKAQMRAASGRGAKWVVIRGDREIEQGLFQLKDLQTGVQEELDLPALLSKLAAAQIHNFGAPLM